MIAYYKSPDMDRGKSLGGDFSSSREADELIEKFAAPEFEDDTLLYYTSGIMRGKAYIVREGKALLIWTQRRYRRERISMSKAMQDAPRMSNEEITALRGVR